MTKNTSEELYMMISPESYRSSKMLVLNGQADLLTSIKHLHNLKILSRQKTDLKKELSRLTSNVLVEIEKLKENLPQPKIPKKVAPINVEKIVAAPQPKKKKSSLRDAIDDELMQIQNKLKQLNG